jgi:hypothetical protein
MTSFRPVDPGILIQPSPCRSLPCTLRITPLPASMIVYVPQ